MPEPQEIGLDEALEALRAELESARRKAAGKDLQFPIESLTVEFKVGVTKRTDGKAGFKIPLLGAELGGSTGYDRETMQTITMVLGSPVGRDGKPVKVAAITDGVKG